MNIIDYYSRADAINDGELIVVEDELLKEAGILCIQQR